MSLYTPVTPSFEDGLDITKGLDAARIKHMEQGIIDLAAILATLVSDGDLLTRANGIYSRLTRAALAADVAFTSRYTSGGSSGALTLINEVVLSSPALGIDFSTIPNTYKHLRLEGLLRTTTAATTDTVTVALNNDINSGNYMMQQIWGHGATVIASEQLPGGAAARGSVVTTGGTAPANSFGIFTIDIPYYKSGQRKGVMSVSNYQIVLTTSGVNLLHRAVFWSGLAAINQITFGAFSGATFDIGSSVSLYGLG